ncbi:MAG: hypothetical protein JRK53_19435 [Deltaproteobacteria bacterium]|nr:hypothetical protein [Deltaproteobacteria bacterium]MBW2285356.1 hypothetical protein [Deltaproteobacteria bacterium]
MNDFMDAVRPGVPLGELFSLSVDRAEALGVSEAYLGPPVYIAKKISYYLKLGFESFMKGA